MDDYPIVRDGLAGLLATMPEFAVVGAAGTAANALEQLQHHPVDVVLMDINLPDSSRVEATRQVLELAPNAAVLMVTMVDDDDESILAALAAGARGYLLEGATAGEIAAALQTVAAGGAVFPGIANRLLAGSASPTPAAKPSGTDDLMPRERVVLDRLAAGASNQQIANAPASPSRPSKTTSSHILDRLEATDRTQAALRARRPTCTAVAARRAPRRRSGVLALAPSGRTCQAGRRTLQRLLRCRRGGAPRPVWRRPASRG